MHTPGPWTFDGPAHNIIVWGPQPEHRVCFMTSDGPTSANARLIAAAPDMLAALEHARDFIIGLGQTSDDWPRDPYEATAKIETAIAKARTETE